MFCMVCADAKAAPDKPDRKRPEQADDTSIWKVPVAKDDPIKGPKDALVTIVEFSEFQCPYCKRVNPTLQQVIDKYKDDVRIVWKDNALPFHKRAKPTATLARMAYVQKGDKGFWEAHDALFESQPKLEDTDLEAIAKKLGLVWPLVKKAIEDDKYKEKIAESIVIASDLRREWVCFTQTCY